jgi:two-component system chemotaxis response regulator CheY
MKAQRLPKILVVDDNPSFSELIALYLQSLGAGVERIAEGRSAIARLRQVVPDMVCLDLMLPHYSGFEICEFIRQTPALRAVPVLFMSSRSSPIDRAEAEEAGANAYLVKPFSRADFVSTVVALLPGLAMFLDPEK